MLTDAMRDWARAEIPRVDVRDQTARFCDYFRGAPGQKGVKVDWLGTWRNWMRRAADDVAVRHRPRSNGTAPMDDEMAKPWK